MKERLAELLKAEKCTPSVFADEIGVQRSNVSHILSGRNNPSFDFLQKTIKRFNNVNAEWMLTGEGNMYKDKNDDLFTYVDENATISSEKKPENTLIKSSKTEELKNEDEIRVERPNLERIVVFYTDNSFKEYLQKKQ